MAEMRSSDIAAPRSRYRSRRIFFADNGWYIATRETSRGPFPSKRIATLELRNFLRSLNSTQARL